MAHNRIGNVNFISTHIERKPEQLPTFGQIFIETRIYSLNHWITSTRFPQGPPHQPAYVICVLCMIRMGLVSSLMPIDRNDSTCSQYELGPLHILHDSQPTLNLHRATLIPRMVVDWKGPLIAVDMPVEDQVHTMLVKELFHILSKNQKLSDEDPSPFPMALWSQCVCVCNPWTHRAPFGVVQGSGGHS